MSDDNGWREFLEEVDRRGKFQIAMAIEVANDLIPRLKAQLLFPWTTHVGGEPGSPPSISGTDKEECYEFDVHHPGYPDSFNFWISFGNDNIAILVNHEREHKDLHKHEIKCAVEDPDCLNRLLTEMVALLRCYESKLKIKIVRDCI